MLSNRSLWAVILGFSIAQLVKVAGRKSLRAFTEYGGMPSGHSSTIFSLVASVGWIDGFDSTCFAITVTIAMLTISDALRVRRKLGMGHTVPEVVAGSILGFVVGTVTALFPSPF